MWKTITAGLGLLGALWAVWIFWYLPRLPCPPIAEISAVLKNAPVLQHCTAVTVSAEHCVVRLQGRVENETQRARVRAMVQALPGVVAVNDGLLRTVGVPFCEILDVLEPLQRQVQAQPIGVKVRLINKEQDKRPVYTEEERIAIEVTTPAAFESFVYVDYYTTDGQVHHLFPNPFEEINLLPPASVYTVGQADEHHQEWQPYPPFGREMIAVIVARHPLVFTPKAPRYDPEPYNLYLDQLKAALPPQLTDIGAVLYMIETRAKP